MEKPIVFLSHSSLDKAPLLELKRMLDDRAAGSLNFFLSSDGESIRFGRNWVVRISDALAQAKLMFVFLSPQSADSKWIHFEAGCAYAKDIQVVPVCLPGIDLNRIAPPLSLLQGFNFHSHEAMGNLARICNETFGLRINEAFFPADFDKIVSNLAGQGTAFFGNEIWAIDTIYLRATTDVPADDFNPVPALHEICKTAGMNCHCITNGNLPDQIEERLEQPGCIVEFKNHEVKKQVKKPGSHAHELVGTGRRLCELECILSPELFQINAALLDAWLEKIGFTNPLYVVIELDRQLVVEQKRQNFTAKLYRGGIRLAEKGGYEFEGLRFCFAQYEPRKLEFTLDRKLEDDRFAKIINRLFMSEVFWEREPDFSEMFQGA